MDGIDFYNQQFIRLDDQQQGIVRTHIDYHLLLVEQQVQVSHVWHMCYWVNM